MKVLVWWVWGQCQKPKATKFAFILERHDGTTHDDDDFALFVLCLPPSQNTTPTHQPSHPDNTIQAQEHERKSAIAALPV